MLLPFRKSISFWKAPVLLGRAEPDRRRQNPPGDTCSWWASLDVCSPVVGGEICCDFGAAISSGSSVLFPLLVFNADLLPPSPFPFHAVSVRPWTNSAAGFYFGQRSPGRGENHQTAFHNHPLCQSWGNCSSLHSAELIPAAASSGSFPELLSPFRANSLLFLVGHRVVGMSSMIWWWEAVDLWKAMGFFLTLLSGAILCWLLCFSYFPSLRSAIFLCI